RQQDLPRAARLFAQALDRARELHLMHALLSAMVGLAGVALARGQAVHAARVLGAIEAGGDSVGIKRINKWLHGERIAAEIRAALDPADFEQARSAGRALP